MLADLPEGSSEAVVCDAANTLRHRFRNEPHLLEPHDPPAVIQVLRIRSEPKRTALYPHVPGADRGPAVRGQALPNLSGSALAVLADHRATPQHVVRSDLIAIEETPWLVEGTQSLRFTVVKVSGITFKVTSDEQ